MNMYQLDFKGGPLIYLFLQVFLYNRAGDFSWRLNNFVITVGNSENSIENQICVADGGNVTDIYEIVNECNPPLQGRYVHVMLKSKGILTLCEVQVYGRQAGW